MIKFKKIMKERKFNPGRNIENWEKYDKSSFIANYSPLQKYALLNFTKPKLPDPIENTYIYGLQGTGKTVLATFMKLEEQKNIYLQGGPKTKLDKCVMISVPELFNKFKESYDRKEGSQTESEILRYYQNIKFLILDDFGAVKPSDWTLHLLYSIIDHRINWMLKTVYTSNFTLKEVEQILGDSRLTSRIERTCVILKKQPYEKI